MEQNKIVELNVVKDTNVHQNEAEKAVETLIRWAGDDPNREGLVETPKRVARAFTEWFWGYSVDPKEYLSKSFEEVEGYHAPVILKDIPFQSHCEHHMAAIIGKAHISYIPNGRVVGISKLARVVQAFARRLQIQEKLTAQIANCLEEGLTPKGVAVAIEAEHHCMTTRGVQIHDVAMITSHLTGIYQTDTLLRQEFWTLIKK
jgi:GTP cyclohydrolase I